MNNYVPVKKPNDLRSHDCKKYSSCNANICPLDPDWQRRTYIKGEGVCFYMLEAQKENIEQCFRGTIDGLILKAVDAVSKPLQCIHSPLKRRLALANKTRSRRANR